MCEGGACARRAGEVVEYAGVAEVFEVRVLDEGSAVFDEWALDRDYVWKMLLEEGADWLNVDDLAAAARF